MKKILLSISCIFALLTFSFAAPAQAKAAVQTPDFQVVSEYVEALEDGSYFRVTILEDVSSSASRSTQTKSGTKHTTYYDANDTALWKFSVHGTFDYNPGVDVRCISNSCSYNIYDSSWENTASSSSKSGNQAIGDATFKKKVLFITTHIENVRLVLSCDNYGNLS